MNLIIMAREIKRLKEKEQTHSDDMEALKADVSNLKEAKGV